MFHADGRTDGRTDGLPDRRNAGQTECRTDGMPDRRNAGQTKCRTDLEKIIVAFPNFEESPKIMSVFLVVN